MKGVAVAKIFLSVFFLFPIFVKTASAYPEGDVTPSHNEQPECRSGFFSHYGNNEEKIRNFVGWITLNDKRKTKIRMRLSLEGSAKDGQMRGVYVFSPRFEETWVSGSFNDKGLLTLYDMKSEEKRLLLSGTFSGECGSYSTAFAGTLHRESGDTLATISLDESNPMEGTLENRYRIAGAEDDAAINKQVFAFWNAVRNRKTAVIADMIRYPLDAHTPKDKIVIRNKEQFIREYDQLFTKAYVRQILRSIPQNLYARKEGIMLDKGIVWFNATGQIISFNIGFFEE